MVAVGFACAEVGMEPFEGTIECFAFGIGYLFGVIVFDYIAFCELFAHVSDGGGADKWTTSDADVLSGGVQGLVDGIAHNPICP